MILYSAAAAAVMALGYSAGGALFLAGQPPSATAFMFVASGASEVLVFLLYSLAGSRVHPGRLVLFSDAFLIWRF